MRCGSISFYVRGDDAYVEDHVARAIAKGYAAFCLTVDHRALQPARARSRQALCHAPVAAGSAGGYPSRWR